MATRRGGWKPTIKDGSGTKESPAASTPAPPRRRRRSAPSDTPLVDAAQKASPRVHTDHRPPAGKMGAEGRISIAIQLGDRWSRIVRSVKAGEYTWAEFCDGLSEEELARGQLKNDDGEFKGRPPSFVPREFHLACQREQKRRFEEMFGSEVLGLTRDFLDLCKSQDIPDKDRAKLLQYAMERVFGGIPKDVRVSQEHPWEAMMVNVVREEGSEEGASDHRSRRYQAYNERLGSSENVE